MASHEVMEAQVVDERFEDERPVRWRELIAVILVVALADVTIYRGHGFSGYAALFAGIPLLLLFGAPPGRTLSGQRHWKSIWLVGILLVVLAGRMAWYGWELNIVSGLALLVAFALALSGLVPDMLEIVVFPVRMMLGGLLGLAHYTRSARRPNWKWSRVSWLGVALPLVTFVAFSVLFVLANPDLVDSFGKRIEQIFNAFRDWLIEFAPHPLRIAFWCMMAWIAVGMLRPLLSRPLLAELAGRQGTGKTGAPTRAPLYAACRNMLVMVIILFATYLVFEFKTLWFRVFPAGFYYSGYAHQGAAWLTVALALATVVLSSVFRGAILHDPRRRSLRRLAWIWSLENVLLAIAVYHRLYIYIGFNGMTPKRIIGIFGISAVLVGFLLVLWKIARNRSFLWLVRRHLWTVALAVYLYSVTPVDVIVVQYNVRRILSGDSAPSVQISAHAISSEGILFLSPLLQCQDAVVREGVRALLAERHEKIEALAQVRQAEGWTSFQLADLLVLGQLRAVQDQLVPYQNVQLRAEARKRFDQYAYQWY